MLKSLIWKELRQSLPIIALAGLVEVYLIGIVIVVGQSPSATVWGMLLIIAALFCGGIGIWQNARETHYGTFLFLLHRPIQRTRFFVASLLIGGMICLLVVVLPFLLYSLWCDSPGNRLALLTWQICAQILLIYLGGYLSTLRPARAIGSQFVPLLAGIFAFFLLLLLAFVGAPRTNPLASPWWWFALGLGLAVEVGFVLAILHVAKTRDFS